MENNNRSSSHAVFNIKLHIVFVTKYRRKTLTPELLDYLKEAFADCLTAWRCTLVEFGGEPCLVSLLAVVNKKPRRSGAFTLNRYYTVKVRTWKARS